MNAVTHLEKVIVGEVSAVTHLEKVIAGETSAVTYTEKVITGEAPPITHLQKVIAGEANPVTHLEYVWTGGTPSPTEHEYTGAVPYTFTANGSPLISWRISGNTVQSATPTPDNPIMPEGTGERTAQLIDYPYLTADGLLSGVTWVTTIHSIKASGVTNGGTNFYIFRNKLIKAGTYRITINGTHKGMALLLRDTTTSTMIANLNLTTDTSTFTLESDMLTCSLYFNQSSGNTSVDIDCTIMLNTGSTALPYEPYGYKLDISSGNTTTPIYLGEVETTRRVKKLVLTGQETTWRKSGAYQGSFYLAGVSPVPISPTEQAYCSHAEFASISTYARNKFCFNGSPINLNLWIGEPSWTIDDFKAYLAAQYAAGTPVTIWYVLATEETGIVNEPLMKIGTYADEVANVATIPTNNGSTTIDVDTTVKPSEIYIKYKGV